MPRSNNGSNIEFRGGSRAASVSNNNRSVRSGKTGTSSTGISQNSRNGSWRFSWRPFSRRSMYSSDKISSRGANERIGNWNRAKQIWGELGQRRYTRGATKGQPNVRARYAIRNIGPLNDEHNRLLHLTGSLQDNLKQGRTWNNGGNPVPINNINAFKKMVTRHEKQLNVAKRRLNRAKKIVTKFHKNWNTYPKRIQEMLIHGFRNSHIPMFAEEERAANHRNTLQYLGKGRVASAYMGEKLRELNPSPPRRITVPKFGIKK